MNSIQQSSKPCMTVDKSFILEYEELVTRIARHTLQKVPQSIQLDDLVQVGMIGLLEALNNFDENQGASFETYAGIRIRGAMLDEVRKLDWTPRSVHKKARMVSQAIQEIEHKTGRDARDSEVAEALGINMDDYHKILRDSHETRLSSIDELLQVNEPGTPTATSSSEPLEGLSQTGFREALEQAISGLPERERIVIQSYYEEEDNLRVIGNQLGVSESRVCQIHSQAILRLRARMGAWIDGQN
ncbi:MAG: RNA polymerase sigma factor FliA [Gammaproteobacteria bacterium]|nr:RNA polymerase sigma factor FliA [Gammaproteobacteria bacterium]